MILVSKVQLKTPYTGSSILSYDAFQFSARRPSWDPERKKSVLFSCGLIYTKFLVVSTVRFSEDTATTHKE